MTAIVTKIENNNNSITGDATESILAPFLPFLSPNMMLHPLASKFAVILSDHTMQGRLQALRKAVPTVDEAIIEMANEAGAPLDMVLVAFVFVVLEHDAGSTTLLLLSEKLNKEPPQLHRGATILDVALDTFEKMGFGPSTLHIQLVCYLKHRGQLVDIIKALIDYHQSCTNTTDSTVTLISESVSQTIRCSECHKDITIKDVRYKCGHCTDFDLCEGCEAITLHHPTHVFLKLKPVAQIAQGSLSNPFPILSNRLKARPKTQVSKGTLQTHGKCPSKNSVHVNRLRKSLV